MAKRLDLKDVNIYYGSFQGVADVGAVGATTQRHRVHRALRLRQIYRAAHPEPDARGVAGCPRAGLGAARRRRTLPAPASIR